MLKNNLSNLFYLLTLALALISCQLDYGDLNNPTIESYLENATVSQLNNLVSGTESATRNNIALYLDVTAVIGREIYRFGSDPRYTTELLGGGANTLLNSNFYITNNWSARYRAVKNANVLIIAANNSGSISEQQRKGYLGFAKTIKAYELLLNLNLTYQNGIRVEVSQPEALGPVIGYDQALINIASLLDSAHSDLKGASFSFPLSAGYISFNTPEGFIKFNRALAARVSLYQKKWDVTLVHLQQSFLQLNGSFQDGVYHVFSNGSGDLLNAAFTDKDQSGEVRLAHPSFEKEIEQGDARIQKTSLRAAPYSNNGLSSTRDVWVYTSSTAKIPLIRNEELILIYAEAQAQSGNIQEAIKAVNAIRKGHQLNEYSGPSTAEALIEQVLHERRYSLFFEGHRWIDIRRYDQLKNLPIDRKDDDVWTQLPLPVSEK